jgi:[acyl-carrier-protein] S-malonyltransferase
MAPARERMRPMLNSAAMKDAKLPVVTNVEARSMWRSGELRDALLHQIDSPVRWVESVRRLVKDGADRAIEIGPGAVLAGLVKRIDRALPVETYSGPA